MPDYCSLTIRTEDRPATDRTPLEQYRPKGYVAGDGDRARALDAAVALTASSWGPPFATPASAAGQWWAAAYELAMEAVEWAIVDALLEDDDA